MTTDGLYDYWKNTIELTEELVNLPHSQFIFFSTVEVYPVTGHSGKEDDTISVQDIRNTYATFKLTAEAIVLNQANNPLIIRSPGLLGESARPNSVTRILSEESPKLTLSPESRFYYIPHEYAADFLEKAMESRISGIYNLCPTGSVTLKEVADGKLVEWGKFTYHMPPLDNSKVRSICPKFETSSKEIVCNSKPLSR